MHGAGGLVGALGALRSSQQLVGSSLPSFCLPLHAGGSGGTEPFAVWGLAEGGVEPPCPAPELTQEAETLVG